MKNNYEFIFITYFKDISLFNMMQTFFKIPTVAVTGGKGGTGKSLIATNLAVYFAHYGKKVLLIDCDVENPNTNILLGKTIDDNNIEISPVKIFTPGFNKEKCNQCGICRDGCYRHAILQFPKQPPALLEHMCSGCETCIRICLQNAIEHGSRQIGKRYYIPETGFSNLNLLIGELQPSEAMSVAIIKNLLLFAHDLSKTHHYDIIIIDTAPGVHCDVELSLSHVNMILCVTEPTPFGEHDLNRILDLIENIGHNAYIILNRANMTDYRQPILNLAQDRNSPILGEIPLDRIVVEDYAQGIPFALDTRDFPAKSEFLKIFYRVKSIMEEEK